MLNLLLRAVFKVIGWTLMGLAFLLKFCGRRVIRWIRGRPTSHGSARWATLRDLVRGKALGGDGIIVGKAYGQFIRFKGDGAVTVCAPQGRGKGVGVVIPNLLEHPGSAIVTDPKGENFAVTHRHRSTLGPTYRLDAIHPDQTNFFNPLSMIRVGTFQEDTDAAQLASFLVTPESRDEHWDTSAKQILTAVIQHVLHGLPPELQTLSTVRELLATAGETRKAFFEEMALSGRPSVAEQARIVLGGIDHPEMVSVLNNVGKALDFWSKDKVGGYISRTSQFDMMDLHREGMTIYVMVPDDKIAMFKPFLRVMMGCAVAALMRGKDRPPPRYKPMLLIDEAKALGYLDILETGMGMLRAYCHTMLIWQDFGQLRRLYGPDGARTFIAGSGAQVIFGVADGVTAREVATDLGNYTALSRSEGSAAGNFNLITASHQSGQSESGRQLLDANEVLYMDPTRCLIVMPGQVGAPIMATKVRYHAEGRWKGLHDPWRAKPAEILQMPQPGSLARAMSAASALPSPGPVIPIETGAPESASITIPMRKAGPGFARRGSA